MARLTLTLTALFFLFAFSYARTPSDLPADDVLDRELSVSLPESDTKPTILLPGQKQESRARPTTTVIESEPEVTEPKPLGTETQPLESANDLPESDTISVDALRWTRPSTIVSFRPINRHFRMNRQFPFRIPHRHCRHHNKPMNPRFQTREVSYGDDMILSTNKGDFDPEPIRGGVRQIPARWVRIQHHHHHNHEDGMPSFSFRHHDMLGKGKFKRPIFREEGEEDEEREKGNERKEREGGFMKRIRKFLNHF